ncbi:zinc finger MYM-type protein 4-like isoform 2-T2 [Menidia menidia]
MATTETDDGHPYQATNEVSTVQAASVVTQEADGQAMDASPGPAETEPLSDCLLELSEDENVSAPENKSDCKAAQPEITELNVADAGGSGFYSDTVCAEETVRVGDIEGGKLGLEPKPAEGSLVKEGNQEETDRRSEDSQVDSSQQAAYGLTADVEPRPGAEGRPESPVSCGPAAPVGPDEMMDVGSVDQMEQEAQMEEESSCKTPNSAQQSVPSRPSPALSTFLEYRRKKNEERQKYSLGKKGLKQKEKMKVRINIGLMAIQKNCLKPQRGKTISLATNPNVSATPLLSLAVKKMKDFNKDIEDGSFLLLYPDGTEVINIPGTQTPFTLADYKAEIGKSYQRISLFLCLKRDFEEVGKSSDSSDSDPEIVIRKSEFDLADTLVTQEADGQAMDESPGPGPAETEPLSDCLLELSEDENVSAPEKESDCRATQPETTELNTAGGGGFGFYSETVCAQETVRDGDIEGGKEGLEPKPAEGSVVKEGNQEETDRRSEDSQVDSSQQAASGLTADVEPRPGAEGRPESPVSCGPAAPVGQDEMMDVGSVDQMEQEAQMEEESSCKTPNSNTGRESSSPAAMLNGMKTIKLSIPRLDAEKLRAVTRSVEPTPPPAPSPPSAIVKEEVVDEEYEKALISSSTSIKDEPMRDDLRIGSVFSVTPGGGVEAPAPQSVGAPTRHMSCFRCKTGLLRGQTAYQRKGSPALFCSTFCLTSSLPTANGAAKMCHSCQKWIFRPQEIILAPDEKGFMKDYCSQSCLTTFNFNKNPSNKRVAVVSTKTLQTASPCSMCGRYSLQNRHEVLLKGVEHKLCSDGCFNRFRTCNDLVMSSCASCGSFCLTKPLMLMMKGTSKTLCSTSCLSKYKENANVSEPCTMCHTERSMQDMLHIRSKDDTVNLFCSSSCVMAFKVQSVSSSGARLQCDSCGKRRIPSYHLAMSDTSIRNFCSMPCVISFQDRFKKNHPHINVFTKLPTVGSNQNRDASPKKTPAQDAQDTSKLSCFHCSQNITTKPELIQIKDKLVFLCSANCANEYKRKHLLLSVCEYCKVEKITGEVKRIEDKDCYFCSDGCRLLFRHELSEKWGSHCHACASCGRASRSVLTAQYGSAVEEFCSEDCHSKYTMLFCHVAPCDGCGLKGKLQQTLALMGGVSHFCSLYCLLGFCRQKVDTQGQLPPADPGEATPVIANVMSLAGQPSGEPAASDRPTQKSSASTIPSSNSGHTGTQMDSTKPPHPPLLLSGQKILKNKALMCRPLVQNKGISCRTQTADAGTQTDDLYPKVTVLPIPVPVYLPVPMNMYSQYTPKPVGLPFPLPVPMFLPVTMDSAERIVETIQEIKQKIPTDPFEAELILMAEMVAEQDEKSSKQDARRGNPEGKEPERPEAPPADGHISSYSDDLDSDELSGLLNDWEDTSSDGGVRVVSRPSRKLGPAAEVPGQPLPEAPPPTQSPHLSVMDVEADLSVETLERMSQQRERAARPPSPRPEAPRRRLAHRKARDKRGRKPQRSPKAVAAAPQDASPKEAPAQEIHKLKSEYGVEAWRRWVQWRKSRPGVEQPRFGSRPLELKENILRCSTAELSYGLCCFVAEAKRPNGEPYAPDSLFYLCLGLQQYLFENGRMENIFMDRFYSKFSTEFTNMLKGFQPTVTASGYVHSRVEEDFLWECKQLGAYSPIVLLNTLLFFCCKHFGFSTVEQHRQLSFAHVMRCTKTNPDNTKTTFLRFYPPLPITQAESDLDGVPAKRRKEEESKGDIPEMMENAENRLRCPVRLYEFYLSKCSESVKQRTDLFYLNPERCCVPNSPLWFSSSPLDSVTMEAMLNRIHTIRQLHLRTKKGGQGGPSQDPPFRNKEDDDGDAE